MADDRDRRSRFLPIPAEYLEPIRSQRAFIIVFCVSAIVTALLLTYIASEKYEAGTELFYQPKDVTSLGLPSGTTSEAFGSPVPQAPFKIIGNTLQDAVTSERILRPVVLALNLHVKAGIREDTPWYERLYDEAKDWAMEYGGYAWQILKYGRTIEEDPVVQAMQRLRDDISITSEDSYIFLLTVRDKYPERAAAIVDALAAELVEWLREQEKTPGQSKQAQLALLLGEVTGKLVDLRGQIESVLTEKQIVSIEHETAEGMERLSDLELDRVRLESEIEENRRKLDELSRRMKQAKASVRGEGRRGEHVQPEDYRRMVSEKLFTEIDLSGQLAKEESLRASIGKLEQRLRELPVIQTRLDQLNSVLSSTDREYVLLNDEHAEAVVRATAQQSEARILHRSRVPRSPAEPIKIYHVGLAAALSLCLSIGLVFLLSFFNIRILFPSLGVRGRRTAPPEAGGTPGGPGSRSGFEEASSDAG